MLQLSDLLQQVRATDATKMGALFLSALQIAAGVDSIVNGRSWKRLGPVIISSGLGGGLYLCQADGMKTKYETKEYAKRSIYGLTTGLISTGFGMLAEGASKAISISLQCLGSMVGNMTATAVSESIESYSQEKALQLEELSYKAMVKVISGLIGVGTGRLTDEALELMARQAGKIASNVGQEIMNTLGDDVRLYVNVLTTMLASGLRSGSSQFTSDFFENYCEKDPEKKKDLTTQVKEARYAAILAASIDGLIMFTELQRCSQLKMQKEQTEREERAAQCLQEESEKVLQARKDDLQKFEQDVVDKQNALKQQEQSVQEQKLQLRKVKAQIENDQQVISEMQSTLEASEKGLGVAQQALQEAQQLVDQQHQAISEAQKIALEHEQNLEGANQRAQAVKKYYDKIIAKIDHEIQRNLNEGGKAKINGKIVKDPVKIRDAYLRNEKIVWKHDRHLGSREYLRSTAQTLQKELQELEANTQQLKQKIQETQSLIGQKQAELASAKDNHNLYHNALADQTQTELNFAKTVHAKQEELTAAQNLLSLYQQEIGQTKQEMVSTRAAIIDLTEKTSQTNTNFRIEHENWQAIVSRKSGLSHLKQEHDAAIFKAQQDLQQKIGENLYSYRPERVAAEAEEKARRVEEAIRPDAVDFVGDSELKKLMPHVVLVQAVTKCSARLLAGVDDTRLGDPAYEALAALKFVLTSQGVVGHHLELEKREYQLEFVDRPHTHWSWNQLVQPHSHSWEDAPVALLEPLSTFESSICNKPFGVAPYDTFIFGPHRLSEHSVILVPDFLQEEDIRTYLAGFEGKIVMYDQRKNLRTAVIETLTAHYPETWHVCDEQGNRIGEQNRGLVGDGCEEVTCLQQTNGEVLRLIKNNGHSESEQISESMKEYRGQRRFIGLHCQAPTDALEKAGFKALKDFTNFNKDAKRGESFAGKFLDNIDFLQKSSILKALEFYNKTSGECFNIFDPRTGVNDVAKYVFKTALHADLASLFYKKYPAEEFDLSPFELKIILESMEEIILLLNSVNENLKKGDKDSALSGFNSYCLMLEGRLDSILRARKMTRSLEKKGYENSFCLTVGLDDWNAIEVPDTLEFDLGNNKWHSESLFNYILKVLHVLPQDAEKRKGLYRYLISLTSDGKDRKEQYREKVLTNILRYAVLESFYLNLRGDQTESILAFKISKLAGGLQEYGLEVRDYTIDKGDCLFDNVAAQLKNKKGSDLRKDVINFMSQHEADYCSKPDFQAKTLKSKGKGTVEFNGWDGYLASMGMPQVWATEVEAEALAELLECPIVIMKMGAEPKIYNREAQNAPVFLHRMNIGSNTAPTVQVNVNELSDQGDDEKIQKIRLYLKEQGFELKGVQADNDSYCHAFLESYKTLKRVIPVLDHQPDEMKIGYLRDLMSSQYKVSEPEIRRRFEEINNGDPLTEDQARIIQGLIQRAQEIKNGEPLIAGEANLLAQALSIPLRIVTIDHLDSINDKIYDKKGWRDWQENISRKSTSDEYIFIVDLGGYFAFVEPSSTENRAFVEPSSIENRLPTMPPERIHYFEACIPMKGLDVKEIYNKIQKDALVHAS